MVGAFLKGKEIGTASYFAAVKKGVEVFRTKPRCGLGYSLLVAPPIVYVKKKLQLI
jgi:hypothetical protein